MEDVRAAYEWVRNSPRLFTLLRCVGAFPVLFASVYVRKIIHTVIDRYLRKLVARTKFRLDDVLVDALIGPPAWRGF